MISLKRSGQLPVVRGSIRSREERVIAECKPAPRYEVFRRTKGDLVRVCVVEVQKPLPPFIQTGPWHLERIASRAELELPDLEARIQQLGYYLFTAPERESWTPRGVTPSGSSRRV